jgi:hypothetical protein
LKLVLKQQPRAWLLQAVGRKECAIPNLPQYEPAVNRGCTYPPVLSSHQSFAGQKVYDVFYCPNAVGHTCRHRRRAAQRLMDAAKVVVHEMKRDGVRVLGRARQAKGRAYYDGDVNLPAFLNAKSLLPFIDKDLYVTSSQIEFKPIKGVLPLMRISDSWEEFQKHLKKAYPIVETTGKCRCRGLFASTPSTHGPRFRFTPTQYERATWARV